MTHRCADPGPDHSADLVSVYSGLAEPTVLCGYHAGKRNRNAGRIWHSSREEVDNQSTSGMMGDTAAQPAG